MDVDAPCSSLRSDAMSSGPTSDAPVSLLLLESLLLIALFCMTSSAFIALHSQSCLYSQELKTQKPHSAQGSAPGRTEPTHLQRYVCSISTPCAGRLPCHHSNMLVMCVSSSVLLYLNFFVPMMLDGIVGLGGTRTSGSSSDSEPESEGAVRRFVKDAA